jgi:hypothetical protein
MAAIAGASQGSNVAGEIPRVLAKEGGGGVEAQSVLTKVTWVFASCAFTPGVAPPMNDVPMSGEARVEGPAAH